MSLSKEHSPDKAEWVKWPHLEPHWQPQHYDTPHRAIKKADSTRSHSWWWDSHISPKSSKWLQENLAEMDSKVNAMLKIIEEDADSFAKRAEMYYKRRPELVSLVEEFYRTYRALVERHTFLTTELRQNIAPALKAQLRASYSTPANLPSDLIGRPGSDGFDIASLSSYTFPGALEFDEDNLIDGSLKKANEDVEDRPFAISRVSFETREYEFKPSSSSSEEEPLSPHHKDREPRMHGAATGSIELKKRIEKLEDENKVLMVKSGEDNVKIEDLQSEVSNLIKKAKALETEEKLAKERFNSLFQLKLSLEAENLKLSHALIACKEEKNQLIEARDHAVQEVLASGERLLQLEQEVSLLEHKMAASHAEVLSGHEQANKFHDERDKLQQALIVSQDESQRGLAGLKEVYESRIMELQKQALVVEEENEGFKKKIATQTLKAQELERQVLEVAHIKRQLEQGLVKSKESKDALELENSTILFRIQELQKELEATESNKQQLLEQIMHSEERVSVLEKMVRDVQEHKAKLETDRDELGMQMRGLEAMFQELQKERDRYLTDSQRLDSQCKALEAAEAQLKEKLASLNSNFVEEMRKSAECQNAAEKRYMDEVRCLQSEELKWRTEASASSALMAEKVATLRMENAALHQDLSLKVELVLKQQKEVESLSQECRNLSQALQDMSAEMQDLRNDLQIFKDIVIPSMEEREVELQDENKRLTVSNERCMAEMVRLSTQLDEAEAELLVLNDKNSVLKVELDVNVEMLKHVDEVVLATAKAQSERLCDKLGLQEQHCHMLEQMLAQATYEHGWVSQKLSSVTQEKRSLVEEGQHLLAMLVEVEQLQRELASARESTSLVRESEPAGGVSLALSKSHWGDVETGEPIQSDEQTPEVTQNNKGGSQDAVSAPVHEIEQGCLGVKHEEIAPSLETEQPKHASLLTLQHPLGVVESDGSRPVKDENAVVSVSSSSVVLEKLKEEITFLQEKIQKLELEGIAQGTRLDDIQRLKEENRHLLEEIESLKGQSLAAWMEHNLIENTVRDLQASKTLLQETNEHLNLEVHSCKEDIMRLQEQLNLLQQKCVALFQDIEVSTQEKRECEETMRILKDVIDSMEGSNRRLQTENELAGEELKQLQGLLANLQEEGTELIAQLKVKIVSTFEEVKLVINDCRKEMGEEGFSQVLMDDERSCSVQHVHERIGLLQTKQGVATESSNTKEIQETMPELVARNRFFLTELEARAEEANMLLEIFMCIRKLLLTFFSSSEHTCQRDALLSELDAEMGEEAGKIVETRSPEKDLDLIGNVHYHSKLGERLHQAFVDEKLELELIELKEGRKQLKEDLRLRLDEVQKLEMELENLEAQLEEEMSGEREGVALHEEKKSKNKWVGERVKELLEMLALQRGQIWKMKEEVMSGEEQQEAAAEDQVTVLVSMESTPNMDGWDDEQVSVLSKELESLRSMNRRHSVELRTISQDLLSMGSIIKSTQDQLLRDSSEDVEEITSIADLRIQKSSLLDLRAQNSRVSIDSTQQLLSPSPHMVEGDSVSARRMSSEGSVGQFALKPRNFGLTWFMLLFSPDRKASSLVRGKSDKAVWAALRRSRRSSSGSAALVVERGRRKAVGCLACVSSTNRLDSFEHR